MIVVGCHLILHAGFQTSDDTDIIMLETLHDRQESEPTTVPCPLCGSISVVIIETIQTRHLIKQYRRSFCLDISSEFGTLKEIYFLSCNTCDLHYYSPAIFGSESFYEQLQKHDWYYLDNKQEYITASRYIGAGDTVLEVGCGKGAFAKLINTDNYVGLELSRNAQAMAEEKGINVLNEFIETHSATHRGNYDVVCSFQVLEHVPDPCSFIDACMACLRPGGILILSVPSEDSFLSIAENTILNMPPHHLTRWTDNALIWVIEQYGLEKIALEHDRLADIHVEWYSNEIVKAVINKMFRRKQKSLDNTFPHKLIDLFCNWISPSYTKILTLNFLRPVGHSVTLVARNP
jgi:2-polyprenyl-3-methyl-5-hydroxy-6-metoxy-1,4-benzoquinol methylase